MSKEKKEEVKPNNQEAVKQEQFVSKRESFLDQLQFLEVLSNYISKKADEKIAMYPSDPYESETTKEINTAFAKAQGEFPSVSYNRENPYFKNKYADYDVIVKTIRPILSKYGLSVTQHEVLMSDGSTVLKTKLKHNSGEWTESRARIIQVKSDPQSYNSALSYRKRTSYATLLNITTGDDPSDDDAETVMYDTRNVKSKGVALNTKYNPKEQSGNVVTKEQLEELEYELSDYDDIAEMVLDGLKIQSLADMPKDKFIAAVKRIRTIKNAREGLN